MLKSISLSPPEQLKVAGENTHTRTTQLHTPHHTATHTPNTPSHTQQTQKHTTHTTHTCTLHTPNTQSHHTHNTHTTYNRTAHHAHNSWGRGGTSKEPEETTEFAENPAECGVLGPSEESVLRWEGGPRAGQLSHALVDQGV